MGYRGLKEYFYLDLLIDLDINYIDSGTLKGHTTSVNSLQKFADEELKHLIVSGSYDTNIKIWVYVLH